MYRLRLQALQKALEDAHLDAYFMNTSDPHLSEYVPEHYKTIRYFTGFTGSLASLFVDREKAYLFVDGRYHTQADNEVLANGVEVIKLGTSGAKDPLPFALNKYHKIGLDGKRAAISLVNSFIDGGIEVKDIDLYSAITTDIAPLNNSLIRDLDPVYCGKTRKEKINDLLYCLNGKTHILSNLESIAYLLNFRGSDISYTPVFLAYMAIHQGDVYLFCDVDRFDPSQLDALYADGVIIRPYASFYEFLKTIASSLIIIDENKLNYAAYACLKGRSNRFVNTMSPIEEMRAIKNPVEQENCRLAHIYDGVAMVRFLKWLKESDKEQLNEYDVLLKLNEFRLSYKAFDLSFTPIIGYNSNAAMMHYSPTAEKNTPLHNEGILLIDSGGQYLEGTTDITRTVALGPVADIVKKHFTLVLKSMFNLSEVHFLYGMSGSQLDVLARKDIWELGINYRCGTGHGVGQVLAVHESIPNVRFTHAANKTEEYVIREGNLFSDEPGIYLEGQYGLRCENMVLAKKAELNEYGQFMCLETVTMCPFDLDLIAKEYLDNKTVAALNAYHQTVYEKLAPYLNEEEQAFLKLQTRSI